MEKAVAMTEKEKALRIAAEQKLASIMNAPAKDVDMITGAEKDRSELLLVLLLTTGILCCSSAKSPHGFIGFNSLILPSDT